MGVEYAYTMGAIVPGQLADLTALSADYFAIPDEDIKRLESVLTIVGGQVVHGSEEFAGLAPLLPPPAPDWSPVPQFGGHARVGRAATEASTTAASVQVRASSGRTARAVRPAWGWTCGCLAF